MYVIYIAFFISSNNKFIFQINIELKIYNHIYIYIIYIHQRIKEFQSKENEQNSPHTTMSIFMSNWRDMRKKMLHGYMQQTQTEKEHTQAVP